MSTIAILGNNGTYEDLAEYASIEGAFQATPHRLHVSDYVSQDIYFIDKSGVHQFDWDTGRGLLVKDPPAHVRLAIATSEKTPAEVLLGMVHDPDDKVLSKVVERKVFSEKQLAKLSKEERATFSVQKAVATVSEKPDTLKWIFKNTNQDKSVRSALASNVYTPPAILGELARSCGDNEITLLVATNPSTPPGTLMNMLRWYENFNNKPQKFTSHGVPSLQGGEEWPCREQGVATFPASV